MVSRMVEVYLLMVRKGDEYVCSSFSKLNIRTDDCSFADVLLIKYGTEKTVVSYESVT